MNATAVHCAASEEDDGGGANLWYVGVFISIIGSIFNNLGQNVQKLAQDKNPEKEYIYLPVSGCQVRSRIHAFLTVSVQTLTHSVGGLGWAS